MRTILTQKLYIENEFEQVLKYHGYINYTNFHNQYESRCYLFSEGIGIISGVLVLFYKIILLDFRFA